MGDQQFHSHPQSGQHVSATHIYALQPQCYQSYGVQQPNDTVIQLRSLQDQLNSLQQQRDGLQKELNTEKQKVVQMSQQLSAQQQLSVQMQQQYEQQMRALQFELSKYKTPQTSHQTLIQAQSAHQLQFTPINKSVRVNGEQVCENCQFRTKSEVSLLLHKVNHGLTQKHLQLPTTIFTTKNNNSTFLYRCPTCDGKFTRHEVYSHIYQYHTQEQPHHCTECDLFFTHFDYLSEHQRDKHNNNKTKKRNPQKSSNKSQTKKSRNNALVSSPGSSSAWNSLETIISSTIGTFDETSGAVASITEPVINSLQVMPTVQRTIISPIVPKPAPIPVEKSDGEFKCTFNDCGFATNTKERLEFHISAHKNSKYKCPYCPYVGNVLVDIKRHIQKSQKHRGFNVFQCHKCDYGSNCEKTFKDHLRQIHFGKEVTDKMINSFIDDMFANESGKESV